MILTTLASIEKKMWDNYHEQKKLIKQQDKLKYNDPNKNKLCDKINILIAKRKVLNTQWNKIKKAETNKEKSKLGLKVGDRVYTVSTGLFMAMNNVIKGTIVMYRGSLKVKLDDPEEFNKKYVSLTKSWKKEQK